MNPSKICRLKLPNHLFFRINFDRIRHRISPGPILAGDNISIFKELSATGVGALGARKNPVHPTFLIEDNRLITIRQIRHDPAIFEKDCRKGQFFFGLPPSSGKSVLIVRTIFPFGEYSLIANASR